MEVVCRSEMFTAASTLPKRTWDARFEEVINKGDKPDICASLGKEMQVQRTYSFEVLHS
jgi:hypothetical protein